VIGRRETRFKIVTLNSSVIMGGYNTADTVMKDRRKTQVMNYSYIPFYNIEHIASAETAADRARASSMLSAETKLIICVAIIVLIILLIIVDVSCFFVNSCGLTYVIYTRVCGKSPPALSKEKTAEEGERYDLHIFSPRRCIPESLLR